MIEKKTAGEIAFDKECFDKVWISQESLIKDFIKQLKGLNLQRDLNINNKEDVEFVNGCIFMLNSLKNKLEFGK